jgi:hypothetical protein
MSIMKKAGLEPAFFVSVARVTRANAACAAQPL